MTKPTSLRLTCAACMRLVLIRVDFANLAPLVEATWTCTNCGTVHRTGVSARVISVIDDPPVAARRP